MIIDKLNDLKLRKGDEQQINFDTKYYPYKQIVQILIEVLEFYSQQKSLILNERDDIYDNALSMKQEFKQNYQNLLIKYNQLERDFQERLKIQTEKIVDENKMLSAQNINQNLYINRMKQEMSAMQDKLCNLFTTNNLPTDLLQQQTQVETQQPFSQSSSAAQQGRAVDEEPDFYNNLSKKEVQMYKSMIAKIKSLSQEAQT